MQLSSDAERGVNGKVCVMRMRTESNAAADALRNVGVAAVWFVGTCCWTRGAACRMVARAAEEPAG
eukprot:2909322-Pleurochrysis_carterae.AAC.1